MPDSSVTKHPTGLYVLFATEMWERFNFYGMRALLVLFLANALRFLDRDASLIYGCFLGLCYLTPIAGGYISDRFLGNRRCIQLGGLIMAAGQFLLFVSGSIFAENLETARLVMWVSLGLLIVGNGLFKPNISSMVGQLYFKGDARLDSAFTVFYMGINVGAFLGLTICPLLGDVKLDDVRIVSAFKWGFLAAGIAMLLSVLVFRIFMNRYIVTPDGKPVGDKPSADSSDRQAIQAVFSTSTLWVSGLVWVLLISAFYWFSRNIPVDGTSRLDLAALINSFIFASGLTLAGVILTDGSLSKIERDRILTLYAVSFFVMFFWACFEQAGSSLTFIADYQTDRNLFGWEVPPSLVQNANSLFIVIFAPLFSALWLWLAARKRDPSSPVKQAIGLGLLAVGFLIIALRVQGINHSDKIGVNWLIAMYLFHTLGELCLSPVGLSLVSKLAPLRFSSLLMGVWFLANAGGYALAGILGALLPPTGEKFVKAQELGIDLSAVLDGKVQVTAEQLLQLTQNNIPTQYPVFVGLTIHNLYEFFMLLVVLPGGAALLLLLLSRLLKRMMHGVH